MPGTSKRLIPALAAGFVALLIVLGATLGSAASLDVSSQDLTIVAQGGATPTPSGDTDPPQLDTLEFFDTDANGKVDEVVATFTDASDLAPYTAGTAPWYITSSSGGPSLASVTVDGPTKTATLGLSEGTAIDTAVTAMLVSLAADPGAIRDVYGNVASFGAHPPR